MTLDTKDAAVAVVGVVAVWYFLKDKLGGLFDSAGTIASYVDSSTKYGDTLSSLFSNTFEPDAPLIRDRNIAEHRFDNDIGIVLDNLGQRTVSIPQAGVGGGFGITKVTEALGGQLAFATSRYQGYNASRKARTPLDDYNDSKPTVQSFKAPQGSYVAPHVVQTLEKGTNPFAKGYSRAGVAGAPRVNVSGLPSERVFGVVGSPRKRVSSAVHSSSDGIATVIKRKKG